MAKIYGQLEYAQAHNLPTASAPNPNIAGILWFDTTLNVLKFGDTGSNRIVATRDATETLTNKTITGATSLSTKDITTTSFNLRFASNSSTALTADRILTFDVVNAARTVKLGGDLTIAGAVTFAGAFAITLTATNTTTLTLPTSGTLVTTATLAKDVFIGTAQTARGTVTNTAFADFTNQPTVTFTPTSTGKYLIYGSFCVFLSVATGLKLRINGSAGSPTINFSQEVDYDSTSNGNASTQYLFVIATLTSGVSYTFGLQGKSTSGQIQLANDLVTNGQALIAQQIG